jgi:hypothetical protein
MFIGQPVPATTRGYQPSESDTRSTQHPISDNQPSFQETLLPVRHPRLVLGHCFVFHSYYFIFSVVSVNFISPAVSLRTGKGTVVKFPCISQRFAPSFPPSMSKTTTRQLPRLFSPKFRQCSGASLVSRRFCGRKNDSPAPPSHLVAGTLAAILHRLHR